MTPVDSRVQSSLAAQAMQAAETDAMPSYKNKDGIVSTFADIISAPDPTPAPKVAEQKLSVKGRKDGEKVVQRFDRQRERRRQELQDEGESLERIDEILAEEFSEERRQEVGRQAQRDTEIAGTDRSRADPTAPRRRVNRKTGKVTVDVPDIGLEGQPDGLVDQLAAQQMKPHSVAYLELKHRT